MNLLLLLSLLFAANSIWAKNPPVTVSTGTIQALDNFGSAFVAPRNIHVWLPDGYSDKMKYDVLYMHDGQMLFDANTTWNKQEWGADEVAGRLIREGKVREFIIVGVFNGGALRHCEYFPQKPMESLSQSRQDDLYQMRRGEDNPLFAATVQSDNYLKFLVKELKPHIDTTYSVRTGAESTFIMGSSMGGLISLYAISEYPGVFGGAACLSTHWPGVMTMDDNPVPDAFYAYLRNNLPSPDNHKIYFDLGDATLDALYPPLQTEVDQIMKSKGYGGKQWVTRRFAGDEHHENAWRARLHIPLIFLLGEDQR